MAFYFPYRIRTIVKVVVGLVILLQVIFHLHLHLKNNTSKHYEQLKVNISLINSQEEILNNFGPTETVIVVQVHKRIEMLRYSIESLSKVQGISEALLVFSHDVYDEGINDIVRGISFSKVLQIFFPFSTQLHPREFPGDDPSDCPRDIGGRAAAEIKCNNYLHPDMYGHYREAKFTQIKHHFWWKMNYVMEKLQAVKHYTGLFLFIEEDHYVVKDVLHILNSMESTCPDCDLFVFGRNPYTYTDKPDQVVVSRRISTHGMAFRRETWRRVVREGGECFCDYDDYNTDWSLQHVSEHCLKTPLKSLLVVESRTLHLGECIGLHRHNTCNFEETLRFVNSTLEKFEGKLFPEKLTIQSVQLDGLSVRPFGGWGDPRDRKLCKEMIWS